MMQSTAPTSSLRGRSAAVGARPTSHAARLVAALEAVDALPANASVRGRFLERLGSDAGLEVIAHTAACDAALAARLLRLANRVPNRPRSGVDTIAAAIETLGRERAQTAIARMPTYSLAVSQDWWSDEVGRFGSHAAAVRATAMSLSPNLPAPQRERISAVALLHDIGKLVLARVHRSYPDSGFSAGGPDDRVAAERRSLGVDHAVIGAVVARRWTLPRSVSTAIETHHAPEAAGAAAIVRLADMVVHRRHGTRVPLPELFDAARHAGVDSRSVGLMLDEVPDVEDGAVFAERCPLSPRQLETIRGLSDGKHYKEIAQDLELAPSTVRSHIHGAYRRLGVSDRAQAVLLAAQRGWIAPR